MSLCLNSNGPSLWVAGPACPPWRVAVETAREHPVLSQAGFVSVPYLPATVDEVLISITDWDGPMVHILPERPDPALLSLLVLGAEYGRVVVACESRPRHSDGLRALATYNGVRVEDFILA